jgi:hypothetical protein
LKEGTKKNLRSSVLLTAARNASRVIAGAADAMALIRRAAGDGSRVSGGRRRR